MILGQRPTPLSPINIQLRGRYAATMLQKINTKWRGREEYNIVVLQTEIFQVIHVLQLSRREKPRKPGVECCTIRDGPKRGLFPDKMLR